MTLVLTDSAAHEIRNLVAAPEVDAESGVRIASTGEGTLLLSLAAEPDADDTIVENAGARVFVQADADPIVRDLALDADVDPHGQVQFSLAQQS